MGLTDKAMDSFGRKLVPTLNGMGYMITALDEVSEAFVQFAATAKKPVLDIGAAYGVATIAALKSGATVIANDIESRHLDQLRENTPVDLRQQLTLLPGAFPQSVEVSEGSICGVLLARVMQFFTGSQIEQTAKWLFQALTSGGKVFIVADLSVFLEQPALRKQYEKQCQVGMPWPGMIDDVHRLWPEHPEQLPNFVHIIDVETLQRTFSDVGFTIERADLFTREVEPQHPHGRPRQSVCLIASKP